MRLPNPVILAIASSLATSVDAFGVQYATSSVRTSACLLSVGYIPDGFTAEEWMKRRDKEEEEQRSKNFAAVGPRGFKSRSLKDFQKDLEKGKATHLMPVMFAKEQVKKGLIKLEDVPYMQRGGSWDNSDVIHHPESYHPDQFTAEEWKAKKESEKKAQKSKGDLGHFGPLHFVSRSLQEFQRDLEKGKARHLMPVMYAKERLEKGLIEPEDVPYMQRGGKWDNSDVKHEYKGYIPDGYTPEQWEAEKERERLKQQSMDYKTVGPTHFVSRSLQSFQKGLENGKLHHLFPVMFAKQRVTKHLIEPEDVPYMQRGGAYDDSDLRGPEKSKETVPKQKIFFGLF